MTDPIENTTVPFSEQTDEEFLQTLITFAQNVPCIYKTTEEDNILIRLANVFHYDPSLKERLLSTPGLIEQLMKIAPTKF